ncbi:hypothetical protein GCM10010350_49710 [Streptomyces galilaeus]|nr:hypothetical protein GCM10010350_49710 [Streptomyces galilaeus]
MSNSSLPSLIRTCPARVSERSRFPIRTPVAVNSGSAIPAPLRVGVPARAPERAGNQLVSTSSVRPRAGCRDPVSVVRVRNLRPAGCSLPPQGVEHQYARRAVRGRPEHSRECAPVGRPLAPRASFETLKDAFMQVRSVWKVPMIEASAA